MLTLTNHLQSHKRLKIFNDHWYAFQMPALWPLLVPVSIGHSWGLAATYLFGIGYLGLHHSGCDIEGGYNAYYSSLVSVHVWISLLCTNSQLDRGLLTKKPFSSISASNRQVNFKFIVPCRGDENGTWNDNTIFLTVTMTNCDRITK